jgi:hypothetical protein
LHEIWVDVPEYYGKYQVSNLGHIRSLNWRRMDIIKNLSPVTDKDGYQIVCLSDENSQKSTRLHRLIAEAFVPNPCNKPHINHKDENKANNLATNLEWTTVKENNNYGTRNKRVSKTKTNNTYNCRPVFQYSLAGEFIKAWPSLSEPCRVFGYDNSLISRCCRGIKKTAYGFKWLFTQENGASKAGDDVA